MKSFVLEFTCADSGSDLEKLKDELGGHLEKQPWKDGRFLVDLLQDLGRIRIGLDAAWAEDCFGPGRMNAALRLEEILNRLVADDQKLKLCWDADNWREPMAGKTYRKRSFGWQKWALGMLVVACFGVALSPLIWIWRLKQKAERRLENMMSAVEEVESELRKQGKRLDAVYGFLSTQGSKAWNAVSDDIAEWWDTDKDTLNR